MTSHSATIRFEVLINGEPRCVAGIEGFGVLSVDVHWVLRDPAEKPEVGKLQDWSKEDLKFIVGGLCSDGDKSVNWAFGNLSPGDEVTIRVLGPGEFDEPNHRGR